MLPIREGNETEWINGEDGGKDEEALYYCDYSN